MEKDPVEPAVILEAAQRAALAPLPDSSEPLPDYPASTVPDRTVLSSVDGDTAQAAVQAQDATGSRSELAVAVPTAAENGATLLRLAKKTKFSGDGIDRSADGLGQVGAAGVVILAGMSGIGVGVEPGPGAVFAAGVATAATGIGGLLYAAVRPAEISMRLPDGYSLQCLRPRQASRDTYGDVAVAVHGRKYLGEEEPLVLTKQRLADVLDVVAAAVDQDEDNRFGSVLVPFKQALRAGLPLDKPTVPYAATVRAFKDQVIWSPYDQASQAVVYPAAQAARLAEIARSDPDSLLQRIFTALASDGRFAGKQEVLDVKNTEIVKVLHGMLHQLALETAGIRLKQRMMAQAAVIRRQEGKPVLGADGKPVSDFHEVWNGQWITDSEDIFTQLDTRNKYNPHIRQQTAKTHQHHASYDLRSHTGDSMELFADAERKLDAGMYDNLQLIRMALQLLEAKEQTTQLDAQELAELPKGNDQEQFAAAARQEWSYKWRLRARFAGRLAVLASAITLGVGIADQAGVHLPGISNPGGDASYSLPSSLRMPLWHIENHGLQDDSPYWRQTGQYAFGGGVWYDVPTEQPFAVSIPAALADPATPHETVTSVFAGPQVWLPIQEGTKVGAVQLTELASGKTAPNNQMLSADGNVLVQANGKDAYSFFKLQYDLVPVDPDEGFHPMHSITVEDVSPYRLDPAKYPGHVDPVGYIKNNFTYDDGDELKRLLSRADARTYTDIIYGHQRCQCVQCNTVAAILSAEQHPDQKMAIVSGYLNTERTGSTAYLTDNEGHAWFDDGAIRDATARKYDANSHLTHPQSGESAADLFQQQLKDGNVAAMKYGAHTGLEQQRAASDKDNPWRNIWKPVAGLALLGAGWLELRRKYMQRGAAHAVRAGGWLAAATAIDPRDAVRLMGWHEYGAGDSPMPAVDKGATYHGEQPQAISGAALDEVAQGGFRGNADLTSRQRRGLKRTARAISRDRRLTGSA